MNPIILSFADGTSFFIGLALTLAADLLILRFNTGRIRAILNVLSMVGIALVILSATPLPVWAYAVWVITAIFCLFAGCLAVVLRRAATAAAIALFAATLGLFIAEMPHRSVPHVTVPNGRTVYVLGDSISAGMDSTTKCWPAVLGDMTGVPVVNLAQAGATVGDALAQASRIPETNSVVILEIGGNDLLGRPDAAAFRRQLDTLVVSLCAQRHSVLMLELPLLPFQNAFGKAQREIADRHDVAMLPKRCFARVLGMENGTLDGLHLSQAGQNAMAATIAGVFRKE